MDQMCVPYCQLIFCNLGNEIRLHARLIGNSAFSGKPASSSVEWMGGGNKGRQDFCRIVVDNGESMGRGESIESGVSVINFELVDDFILCCHFPVVISNTRLT